MSDFEIQGVKITRKQESVKRLVMLLWGPASSGKTTLAGTAPGKKLVVNFDPGGHESIAAWDDVDVLDLSSAGTNLVASFKSRTNPLGLAKIIEEYDTFIFDSLTNVAHIALQEAIANTPKATIEFPGIPGYAVRNSYMVHFMKNLLALTGKHGKHCIMIAHEGSPTTTDDGVIQFISMALSGDMPNRAAIDFSEVWNISQNKRGEQIIMTRPARLKQPCKTRMFKKTDEPEFKWKFNAETQEGMTIKQWWEDYIAKGDKLDFPK